MALKFAVALASGLILAGCASHHTPAPLATNFATTGQPKLQAAQHWAVISQHIEKTLLAELKKSPPRPVYIAEPAQANAFQRALASQLTTSLVNDGFTVSRAPAGSLKVEMDVQALTFTADRPQYRYHGNATALAGGVWALSAIEAPFIATAAVAAGGHDAYTWFNGQFAPGATPKTEIIVTVSVSDQYRYVARNTSAYYVADTDRQLYGIIDPPPPEGPKLSKAYQVRGD